MALHCISAYEMFITCGLFTWSIKIATKYKKKYISCMWKKNLSNTFVLNLSLISRSSPLNLDKPEKEKKNKLNFVIFNGTAFLPMKCLQGVSTRYVTL